MKETAEQETAYQRFKELVNMAPAEIEKWLTTEESNKVGQDSGDGESIGRKSARRIKEIKQTKIADLKEADYEHMHKVISYISRHLAQEPAHDLEASNWLYSLKNWGHDPLKK